MIYNLIIYILVFTYFPIYSSLSSLFDFKYKKLLKSYHQSDISFNQHMNQHIYYSTAVKNPSLDNIMKSMTSSKYVAKQLLVSRNKAVDKVIPMVILQLTHADMYLSTLKMIYDSPHLVDFTGDCTDCIMSLRKFAVLNHQLFYQYAWYVSDDDMKRNKYVGYNMLLKYIYKHKEEIANSDYAKELMNDVYSFIIQHSLRPYLTQTLFDPTLIKLMHPYNIEIALKLCIKSRWINEFTQLVDFVHGLLNNPRISDQVIVSLQKGMPSYFELAIRYYNHECIKILLSKQEFVKSLTLKEVGDIFIKVSEFWYMEIFLTSDYFMDKLQTIDFYHGVKKIIMNGRVENLSKVLNHSKLSGLSLEMVSKLYANAFRQKKDVVRVVEGNAQLMSRIDMQGYQDAWMYSISNGEDDEPFRLIWIKENLPLDTLYKGLIMVMRRGDAGKLKIVLENPNQLHHLEPLQISNLLDFYPFTLSKSDKMTRLILESDVLEPFMTLNLSTEVFLSTITNGRNSIFKLFLSRGYHKMLSPKTVQSGLEVAIQYPRISILETFLNYPDLLQSLGPTVLKNMAKKTSKIKGIVGQIFQKRMNDLLL